jgi:hypothetical protein
MKQPETSERQQIDLELDARACEQAVWVGLRLAQRLNWPDVATTLTLCHAAASERRRTLEVLS